jgi:radical SAM superfamily enzyme YgiQ (UPF0313 family)
MEANSVLIQTTFGCTHNKCTFCSMFDDKRFGIRDLNEVFEDMDEARRIFPEVKSFFLIDGNVLALTTAYLLKILNRLTKKFPEAEHITLYASYNDMRRKSVEELKELRAAGLTKMYAGLESGDPVTLERIRKGLTPEQARQGAAHAKEAGIKVLASFILGMGGRERSQEHITATTDLLNVIQPEEIAPMALTIQPGTELERQVRSGEFVQATPLQMLLEEKYLLEHMDFTTFYWGDHGNNIVSSKGWFPDLKEEFLTRVENAIANNPITEQDVLLNYAW